MKLAIMQPYVFPYIGYFHLIQSVDKFVFLEDVSYINRGWINRNRIASLDGKGDYLFTIPLEGASQNKKINEIRLHSNYEKWLDGFHKTFKNAYRNAPHFVTAEGLLSVFYLFKPGDLVSDLAKTSIIRSFELLNIALHGNIGSKEWGSSTKYGNQEKKKGERLIDICQSEGAKQYHNAIGGQELYTKEQFAAGGVELSFIKSDLLPYRDPFVAGLSILDIIAHCDVDVLRQQLLSYSLL
jgi:hypothetical protein